MKVSTDINLGPAFTDGPEGVDRSLLAHVLSLQPEGWAAEFGVGTGGTLAMIAAVMPAIGFDSERGLPADWRPGFKRGKFRAKMPDLPGTTLVPGWFEDTVPGYDFAGVGLFHIDCDMYASTVTVLDSIGPYLLPGVLVVFDEFHGFEDDESGDVPGEQRAWREFVEAHDVEWDVIGRGREQWAVRIR